MSSMLVAFAVALIPPGAVVALLWLSERRERQRDTRLARQIELTDAIHRSLGAVTAPTVEERRGGGLVVRMEVPLHDPGLVTAILTVTERVFPSANASPTVDIVLTPRRVTPTIGPSRSVQKRVSERAVPMTAVAR